MSGPRHVVVHGHFYQPPRENPWLETVETQPSAAPFRDWNARVTAECYAPNTAARRVDAQNRIIDVVDNFERISFNVGPTLFDWLARERPDVVRRIVAADRLSVSRRGRGNAIAQAYNHLILPLASRRDKITQVRWGLADFRHRFGREAEGMWLPETAVDRETLDVLGDEGIRFTILALSQASPPIDPTRAYRYRTGRGRELALFFYEGAIAHAVAFGDLLRSGEAFAARLLARFEPGFAGPQLVHVATDGESYGHHHRFGDMALAVACHRLEREPGTVLTNYAAFLGAHPPADDVGIVEGSSWSCAHGVERWRSDCGCHVGHPAWHQRWRGPLRDALDWLRDQVDPLFEARAGLLLKDPWAARDDYIQVVLDRSPESLAGFLARHATRRLGRDEVVRAVKCLELERQRMLMYTSCGWFFDELSGIETVQILRYAARVIELARELEGCSGMEDGFVRRLAAAPSNRPELATGDVVYRRLALPALVTPARVVAHDAAARLEEPAVRERRFHAFRVELLDGDAATRGDATLRVGWVRVTSEVTTEGIEALVAIAGSGSRAFRGVVRIGAGAGELARVRDALLPGFVSGEAVEAGGLDQVLPGVRFGPDDLLPDERHRLAATEAERTLRSLDGACRRAGATSRRLVAELGAAGARVPPGLRRLARFALQQEIEDTLGRLLEDGATSDAAVRITALAAEARTLGLDDPLDAHTVATRLEQALGRCVDGLRDGRGPGGVATALAILDLGRALGAAPDLWAAQTEFADLWRRTPPAERGRLAPLGAALDFAETFA
jgi:alpha-amylase/alpha-mannosidase (GH57 family)